MAVAKKRGEIERALDRPGEHRFFLLHGPDESSSRTLAKRVDKALGAGAERIDLTGAVLKGDPARLADEASAISMFGGQRWILVDPAGDDALEAVRALIEAPASTDPVVIVAGTLRKDSKLLKLATDTGGAIAFASYPLEGAEADRAAIDIAREQGLDLRADVARRLVSAAAGDRMVLASEIAKLALYLDADPTGRVEVDHDALDHLLASGDEGDQGKLVDAVLDGKGDAAAGEIARLGQNGVAGIPILRALQRRLLLLARLRAEVDRGNSVRTVMATQGKAIFWKEVDTVSRQLGRWRAPDLARALDRVMTAERAATASAGPGIVAADEELLAIARQAARMR